MVIRSENDCQHGDASKSKEDPERAREGDANHIAKHLHNVSTGDANSHDDMRDNAQNCLQEVDDFFTALLQSGDISLLHVVVLVFGLVCFLLGGSVMLCVCVCVFAKTKQRIIKRRGGGAKKKMRNAMSPRDEETKGVWACAFLVGSRG